MGGNLLKRGNIRFEKLRCCLVKKFLEESFIRKPKYTASNRNPGLNSRLVIELWARPLHVGSTDLSLLQSVQTGSESFPAS